MTVVPSAASRSITPGEFIAFTINALSVATSGRWGGGRRQNTDPAREYVIRITRLGNRRHVWQQWRAFAGRDRQRAQPSCIHLRQCRAERRKAHVGFAADPCCQRRAAAFVRHVHEFDPGLKAE